MSDVDPRTGLAARLEESRANPAFRNYEKVRSAVLAMLAASASPSGEARPSEYWEEELAGFEYMLDASPLIVEKLRHHTYHMTGLKVYDYRTTRRMRRRVLAEARRIIEAGGRELLVPESPKLGGFGFEIDGELFNVDTLKFFEVLIALDRGAVLKSSASNTERRLVLRDRRRLGWLRVPVQDAVPEHHLRHHRPARAVPVLRDLSDDGFPERGCGSWRTGRRSPDALTGAATTSSSSPHTSARAGATRRAWIWP